MNQGIVQIYYGEGHGKTTAAIGNALRAAGMGEEAVIIEFLKGKHENNTAFFKRLEPELKYFNFSKSDRRYTELDEEQMQEEKLNQRNGFNYARKEITTGACSLIVLDEILGLEDLGIVAFDEIRRMLLARPDDMTVILTGRVLDDRFRALADEIYNIEPEK